MAKCRSRTLPGGDLIGPRRVLLVHLLFLWVSGRPASLAFQLALPSCSCTAGQHDNKRLGSSRRKEFPSFPPKRSRQGKSRDSCESRVKSELSGQSLIVRLPHVTVRFDGCVLQKLRWVRVGRPCPTELCPSPAETSQLSGGVGQRPVYHDRPATL